MPQQEIRVEGDTVFFTVGRRAPIVAMVDICDIDVVRTHWFSFARFETNAFVRAGLRGERCGYRLTRILLDPPSGKLVDHINGNPLDNRRANLRIVSAQQNCRNRAKSAAPFSSKFKGVSKTGSKWAAVIYHNYRQIRLGRYADETCAAEAYDRAARELFGPYATVNFPVPGEQSALRTRTIDFHPSEVPHA